MSRYTITIVGMLVLALLASTAGLAAASRTMPDIPAHPAAFAAAGISQSVTDGHDDAGPSVKLEGRVKSDETIDSTRTLVVGSGDQDVTVVITPETEIKHGPIDIGDRVKVKGWLQPDGTVVARRIDVKEHHDGEDECQKREFYGPLTAFTGTHPGAEWTIKADTGEQTVLIDENTKIEGTPVLDALVKVEACEQADGTLLARELEVYDGAGDDHDRVQFRGTIEELPATPNWHGTWRVGHWLVRVATGTAIVGPTPEIGRRALVKGTQAPPGSGVHVFARQIVVQGPGHPGHDVETVKIAGAITHIPYDPTVVPAEWAIEGIPVTVDINTLIVDHHVAPAIGVWADARAVVQHDGSTVSYLAIRIKVKQKHESPGEVRFEGLFVEEIASSQPNGDKMWNVSGWEVIIPADIASSVSADFGDRVKIKAIHDDGGTTDNPADDTYRAFNVKVQGEGHH